MPEVHLHKGDRVELRADVPGQPALRAGMHGVVLLTAEELAAGGLCTIRLTHGSGMRSGRHIWQLHPRDLRYLGPAPSRGRQR
jgi:hypothetical protein